MLIIDFRYHLASLIAVFLALGIGILIGGAVLGNAALQKELNQIEENLAKLRTDQRVLEAEIAKREAELKILNQFGATSLPVLVRNKLLGKRIALIRTNPSVDARLARDLTRVFQIAGAKVTSTSTILRNPADLTLEKLQELKKRLDLDGEDNTAIARGLLRFIADRIANGPMFGAASHDDILSTLVASRLIETSGDYGGMVDAVILIGGSPDANVDLSQQVDRVLIETVSGAKGLLVAAVETSTAARSYLGEYLQHPIIVVDNVETVPGQAALILALVRGKKGHYGIKDAHQLMPEAV